MAEAVSDLPTFESIRATTASELAAAHIASGRRWGDQPSEGHVEAFRRARTLIGEALDWIAEAEELGR